MTSLAETFGRKRSPTTTAWQPEFVRGADRGALEELLRSGRVLFLHDTFRDQARELVETRHPRPANRARLDALVDEYLAGQDPDFCGTWVFFPWSGRLVHVLAESDYRELRTSRNQYKITADEQQRLRALRIGVVGLSVGSATAVTLALEEIGGELRLADFDALSLSNMNRLRSGVQNVGVNKAVLTAREIFELNPFARIKVFTEGLTPENLDNFLVGDARLDLLIEECDDLYLKIRLREKARALRMPVLMETSDRGLIDVERFDLEPDRPLLHGLIGDTRAEDLRGLSTTDKVPFVLDILGIDTISERFAASLFEIDRTLRTWPQLASGVALGGALNADTARRIALGTFTASGRFYADLARVVSEGAAVQLEPRGESGGETPPEPPLRVTPSERLVPADDDIRALVRVGTLAPSGGNCQPWRFEFASGELLCFVDSTRSRTFLDVEQHASQLALGAAVENIRLAAAAMGFASDLKPFPDSARAELACSIRFSRGGERVPASVIDIVEQRVTNRKRAERSPLSKREQQLLQDTATRFGATLHLATAADQLDELGRVLGEGDRLRFLHERTHREMMSELRWTVSETLATRDGLDVRTLELNPTDLAAMRLTARRDPLRLLQQWDLGSALTEQAEKSVRGSSALGFLVIPPSRDAYFSGGRAMQQVWLTATTLGLGFQPVTALPYIGQRIGKADDDLSLQEKETLLGLQRRYRQVFELNGETELMLFRLSRAERPALRSLRRDVSSVLRFVR